MSLGDDWMREENEERPENDGHQIHLRPHRMDRAGGERECLACRRLRQLQECEAANAQLVAEVSSLKSQLAEAQEALRSMLKSAEMVESWGGMLDAGGMAKGLRAVLAKLEG